MPDVPRDPDTTDDSASTREPEPSKQPRRQIGPYRLLQRVGEGGMGEVWLAEQTTPVRRQVALKVIKAGMDTAQVVARFEAERQALALMDHSAIATVFDGGTTPEGRPYFVMEYVKGEPITTYCDRQRLTVAERLELFTRVCEGVQHAHQKGIIHRDLKPGNVLVTIQDEKPVPKIIDFGVAKATAQHLTERTLFTELGVMVGTPEYMSPEQAEMTGVDIDTRTDVYALGVILYELLTGALPFDREELRRAGFLEIQRTIREKEPPRPSTRVGPPGPASTEAAKNRHTEPKRLVSDLRGDLDWITMKALEKDRTRRYASVSDVAADIQRHLTDRPVLAGPPSLAYTAKKFVHRHRVPVIAALLVLAALVAGLVGITLMYTRASRAEVRAQKERTEAVWQNYIANLAAADSSLRMHEVVAAKRRLAACDPMLRNWEWRYLLFEVDSSTAVLRAGGDVGVRAWFAPDGSRILGLTSWRDDYGQLNGLLAWERSGRRLATRYDQEFVLAMSPDGERVTDGSSVKDSSSGRIVSKLEWNRTPEGMQGLEPFVEREGKVDLSRSGRWRDFGAVALSPDGTLVATAGARPYINDSKTSPRWTHLRVWDAASGKFLATLARDCCISALEFSPNSARLVSGSSDGTVRVWDLKSQSPVATLKGHTRSINAVAFSRDGTRLTTGSYDTTVRLWDLGTGGLLRTMAGHDGAVTSVGFSPDGRMIVSGAMDKTVRLWDAESGFEVRCLHGHDRGVLSVAFNPDGNQIVSGSEDGMVRLWPAPVADPLDRLVRHDGIADLSHNQSWTVVATNHLRAITIWAGLSGHRLTEISFPGYPDQPGTAAGFRSISLNGDGSRIVTGGRGVRVWDTQSGQQLAVLGDPARSTWAVAYRPDSARIATADGANETSVWDANNFQRVLSLRGQRTGLGPLTYSPDGRILASGEGDGTVRLWDDASGRVLRVLRGHTGSIWCLEFSPDGAHLASAGRDGTARLWDTHSGQLIAVLRGHDSKLLESVSFSPDGSRVVTAADDRTVRVWDARTGDQLLVLRYQRYDPGGAVFTPDGDRIVSWMSSGDRKAEPRLIW